MKEVFLHIGMHKTGTSTIQKSLHGYNKNGIKTIGFDEANHQIPLFTIFSKNGLNYRRWKVRGFTQNRIIKIKENYIKILEKEATDNTIKKLIISGEDLGLLKTREQIELCKFFKNNDFIVKIIYIIREPHSWIRSSIQQNAKHGAKAPGKKSLRYKERVDGFLLECGPENVMIYKYEDLRQKGLIQCFSEFVGADLKEVRSVNKSISHEALSLIYLFNNHIKTINNMKNQNAKNKMFKALKGFFSIKNGFSKIDFDASYYMSSDDTENGLKWLEDNFGLTYDTNQNSRGGNKYIDVFPSQKELIEFFEKNSLIYDTRLNLEENIQNMYAFFLNKVSIK